MKKIFFAFFCFAFLGFSEKTYAQVDVTISPFTLILGGDINAGADFRITDNISVDVRAGYKKGGFSIFSQGFDMVKVPATITGKYYFNPKRGADGFSAELFFRNVYRDLKAQAADEYASAKWNRGGLGFGFGYKLVSEKGFVLDLGVGLGRKIYNDVTYDTSQSDEKTDVIGKKLPIASGRIAIGYRFGGSKSYPSRPSRGR